MYFSYPLYDMLFIGIYLIVLSFIFGAVFASFITCTAWRVVRGEDWKMGHSHCDTCGHELSTADLFPIVSYVALKVSVDTADQRYLRETLSSRSCLEFYVLALWRFMARLMQWWLLLSRLRCFCLVCLWLTGIQV